MDFTSPFGQISDYCSAIFSHCVPALVLIEFLQSKHLAYDALRHFDCTRQHKQVKDQLAHIRPYNGDSACALLYDRLRRGDTEKMMQASTMIAPSRQTAA